MWIASLPYATHPGHHGWLYPPLVEWVVACALVLLVTVLYLRPRPRTSGMVGGTGLEPVTSALSALRLSLATYVLPLLVLVVAFGNLNLGYMCHLV